MTFFGQLGCIHFGWGCNPQLHGNVTATFEQLGSGTEVANVGHARTDEHFVNFGACNFRHQLGIIWIVRAAQDWLFQLVHVDLEHVCIFCVGIGFEQVGVGQPSFNGFDATLKSTLVAVTFSNHVLHQNDVGGEVLFDGLGVELHGTTCS